MRQVNITQEKITHVCDVTISGEKVTKVLFVKCKRALP